ncbi:MAG: adenine deaminase [Angelakisella sp.]
MNIGLLKENIMVSSGVKPAELVLKNGMVVNVFTNRVETCDVAINNGYIVGLGKYSGTTEVDVSGKYICPGLIDGHIHLESSMISPKEFEKAVLPHGTTAVVTDPHEIANVCGLDGIEYILQSTEQLTLDCFVMLPSCVPATSLDESGAHLTAEDLAPYFASKRVLGLAEMMNSYGTVTAEDAVISKLCAAHTCNKPIDGHAPFLSGTGLNAYVTAGVRSDHECSCIEEAMEKLSRGQYIMIREGTAAQNLRALIPLFQEPYCNRSMLVTDDKHPGDLVESGHIDYIIRKAVSLGADPLLAVKMATLVPAQYFGLENTGAVAPGYTADIIVVSDLKNFRVEQVYKDGKLVSKDGANTSDNSVSMDKSKFPKVYESFALQELTANDFLIKETGAYQRVISLVAHELLTNELIVPYAGGVSLEQDIIKLAVFERHHNTGHSGLGFLHGYGLQKGAVASSVAHDSHNLIIAGTNDTDMALAGNVIRKNCGGLAFVADGQIICQLPLPIAGLMSDQSAEVVQRTLDEMKSTLEAYGVSPEIDAFMTLAFVSLPVIPKLRLNTYGLVDVDKQQIVPAVF